MVAKEVETSFYPADERLVRVLLQSQRPQYLVDRLHRPAQLPARWRKNKKAIHEPDIEQAGAFHPLIKLMQKERRHHNTIRHPRICSDDDAFNGGVKNQPPRSDLRFMRDPGRTEPAVPSATHGRWRHSRISHRCG